MDLQTLGKYYVSFGVKYFLVEEKIIILRYTFYFVSLYIFLNLTTYTS